MEENEIFVEELIERLMEYYIRIRKESGVSQSELERITGMSRSAINRYKNGQETAENMTQFAFGNARKSPEVFKEGLVKTINDMLK